MEQLQIWVQVRQSVGIPPEEYCHSFSYEEGAAGMRERFSEAWDVWGCRAMPVGCLGLQGQGWLHAGENEAERHLTCGDIKKADNIMAVQHVLNCKWVGYASLLSLMVPLFP